MESSETGPGPGTLRAQMELLRIQGDRRLEGRIPISGSKNAALPVMAASLLTDQPIELRNVPNIEDIGSMARMLEHIGVTVRRDDVHEWELQAAAITSTERLPKS